jgi:glutamate synthase (NADPH/NADH) large chain
MQHIRRPRKHQLYDPAFEHDACGVGFVAHLKGKAAHKLLPEARQILVAMAAQGGEIYRRAIKLTG